MYLRLLDICGVLFGVMFSVLVYDAGRLNDNRAVYKQSYNLWYGIVEFENFF